MAAADDSIWGGAYKIPWDEPGFSKRMLTEHLSQSHDMASRRFEWIDRQVDWIHRNLLNGKPSDILDLGCGPGFYSHRLISRGHQCRGIDFGPASIEYASNNNPDASRCQFVLGDIRNTVFGEPYDVAMILFGEMNVFSPVEIAAILRKCQASLAARRGRLIIEIETPESVERRGRSESSDQQFDSGLFSDQPHQCRTENRWLPEHQATIQTFTITNAANDETQVYRSTTKAWASDNLTALLVNAGFHEISQCGDWPCNTDSLVLWSAIA